MNAFQKILSFYSHNPNEETLKESLKSLFFYMPEIYDLSFSTMYVIKRGNGMPALCPRLLLSKINGENLTPHFRLDNGEIFFNGEMSPFRHESFKSFLIESKIQEDLIEEFSYTLLMLSQIPQPGMDSIITFSKVINDVLGREINIDWEE